MKNTIKILLSALGLFLIGCSNNSNDNSNPIGFNPIGGGGNNNNVTFKVSVQQNQNGEFYFTFIPSVNIKLTKIDAVLNGQSQGTINGDGTTVYSVTDGFSIGPTNVTTGENWTFTITGKTEKDNKDFTSTVNYTVPQITGGGNEDVTFQVSLQQDQQGGSVFLFIPSVDVKLTKIDATLNGQTQGTVNGDGATVFTAADGFTVTVNNPTSGDKWVFAITGTIAKDGKAFSSTVNYTVP